MTKREFDQDTKFNIGGPVTVAMRDSLRAMRRSESWRRDFIADRAWGSLVTGRRVMVSGSGYRTLAAKRRAAGEPLLSL